MLQHDILTLRPSCDTARFDLALYHDKRFYRIQIKSGQKKKESTFAIPVRKAQYNRRKIWNTYYTPEDIDFIIGVILETGDLYCFPVAITQQFKDSIWVNPIRNENHPNCAFDYLPFKNHITLGGTIINLETTRIVR